MSSAALYSVWAKTGHSNSDDKGKVSPDLWLPLWRHLDDTALVAGRLWDSWLSNSVRNSVGKDFDSLDAARSFVIFIAGIHDVGKTSPAFSVQVHDKKSLSQRAPILIERMRECKLDFVDFNSLNSIERSKFRHESVGQVAFQKWLLANATFDNPVAKRKNKKNAATFGIIIGGHHGAPPSRENLEGVGRNSSRNITGINLPVWDSVQVELIERAWESWGASKFLSKENLVNHSLSQSTQVLITALVIMADWIASDENLFPLVDIHRTPVESDADMNDSFRLESAWETISLPLPWSPVDASSMTVADFYASRFASENTAFIPRPSQIKMAELARTIKPGLMILEAPMGEGKTEAALAAAEILAQRVGANGIFVALPTMATSDAMLTRVRKWLGRIPDASNNYDYNLWLGTSRSFMNKEYGSLFKPSGIGIDDDNGNHVGSIFAHRWMSKNKRGPLSSFAVGTIDHILFSSLKVKHLSLRHLGLANKVIIIDEVHAADVYMSVYLERALEWLGFYNVPVVLLSATLPAFKRASLTKAYVTGQREYSGMVNEDNSLNLCDTNSYPLLTVASSIGVESFTVQRSSRAIDIKIQMLKDDNESLFKMLEEKMENGGCAVIIRNTVRRVQDTVEFLRAKWPEADITVAHSQFMATDRARIDSDLVTEFGPRNTKSRIGRKRIVVATQVVEQSLDIDFDLMITDLAPIDLILQRLGRLHRHERGNDRPLLLRSPHCYITGGNLIEDIPEFEGGAKIIYGEYLLLRTLGALFSRIDAIDKYCVINLPQDISLLVEEVYDENSNLILPLLWKDLSIDAFSKFNGEKERRVRDASNFRLEAPQQGPIFDWINQGAGNIDDASRFAKKAVRDGDESLEVIIVVKDDDGILFTSQFRDGKIKLIPIDNPPTPEQARGISETVLRLPYSLSHRGIIDSVINTLEEESADILRDWKNNWILAGQLPLVLDNDLSGEIGNFALKYDHNDGLRVEKIK